MSQLSEGDIDKMKVEELKKELKKRSCTVGGKKAELQQRLIRSIASEKCLLKSFISQGSSQGSSPPDNLANERDAEKNGQSVRLAPRHGDDQESAAANTRKLVEGAWGAPRRTEGELLASAVQATSSRPAVFMTAGVPIYRLSDVLLLHNNNANSPNNTIQVWRPCSAQRRRISVRDMSLARTLIACLELLYASI